MREYILACSPASQKYLYLPARIVTLGIISEFKIYIEVGFRKQLLLISPEMWRKKSQNFQTKDLNARKTNTYRVITLNYISSVLAVVLCIWNESGCDGTLASEMKELSEFSGSFESTPTDTFSSLVGFAGCDVSPTKQFDDKIQMYVLITYIFFCLLAGGRCSENPKI